MFRPSPTHHKQMKRLNKILTIYCEIAGSDPDPNELRNRIPSQEVWRFLMDGRFHGGRGLAKGSYFKPVDPTLLELTVKEYIEMYEKTPSKDKENLTLEKFLIAHRWFLNEKEIETLTLADLIALDRGWLPFEASEPGYIEALVTAFQAIFDFSNPFDNNFIEKLHALAGDKVQHTDYEKSAEEKPGKFRSAKAAHFNFNGTEVSEAGIKQILAEPNASFFFRLCFYNPDTHDSLGSIKITLESIAAIKQYIESGDLTVKKFCEIYDETTFIEQIQKNPVIMDLIAKLSRTQDSDEAAQCLFKLINNRNLNYLFMLESFQPNETERTLAESMQRQLEIFESEMANKTITPLAKLLAIIRLIQFFERLHPFVDLNTRTFSMLALPHLLMRYGFPPTILFNPNQIGTVSDMEALDLVLEGMENTLRLAKGEKLFGVDTNEILDFLRSHEHLKEKEVYITNVFEIEENARYKPRYAAGY